MKQWIKRFLNLVGIEILSSSTFQASLKHSLTNFNELLRYQQVVRLLHANSLCMSDDLFNAINNSKSQFGQDIFAICQAKFKRGGYFVEFGAADGVEYSNTFVLEREFGWTGILAEPARGWMPKLIQNRKCEIESLCVWRESGKTIEFNETEDAVFSTMNEYSKSDQHSKLRTSGRRYSVETISLDDMLDKHGAPACIDFVSIDTEGSEYEILQNFNFQRYRFNAITIEHNFRDSRELIYALLTKNGYRRVHANISQVDDWYIGGG